MSEIDKLEQAIAAIEAQRAVLGDATVETMLAPAREKLAALKAQPPPSVEQQRKQVTVLFADVSGFTAMSETMDVEDVTETMNSLWQRLDTAIMSHGGKIDKHIGDAVMALWGVEAAHEDDPEQAISAALAMQNEIHGFVESTLAVAQSGRKTTSLRMRIGINTGLVLLSPVGTMREFTAMGDVVNVASRLEHAAPVGGILISHGTYRHVRGVFEARALEPIIVKGKAEPLRVYVIEAARPRAFRVPTRGVEGVETRTIGREVELKHLQDAFDKAVYGSTTRLVTVVGEAGVGKSRLLYEFGNWLDLLPVDMCYFKGRATQQMRAIPYALLRDLLAFRFEIRESDSAAVVRNKLEHGVAQFMLSSTASAGAGTGIQTKAHILGAWMGYDLSDSPHLAGMRNDPRQLHDRALLCLGEFFTAVANNLPAIILLEDIHWADSQSLEALQHLIRQCPALRLLIVGLARPTLFERHPAWGEGQSFFTRLDLRPLSESDSHRLAEEILQKADAVPSDLYDLIVSRAEGNPFYVEELIKMLMDDGVIVTATDPWRVEPARLASLRVPPTLTGVLQARLDSLQPQEKVTLQRASVVGRIFWEKAVEQLGDEGRATSNESHPAQDVSPAIHHALTTLRSRELVFRREPSAFVDTEEYIFKHALLRDVTYESVLKRERKIYHAQVASWLVEVTQRGGRSDEYAALIAEHYEQAGEAGPAAMWFRRAGAQAAARFANAEAVRHFSRALELTSGDDAAGRYTLLLGREKVYDLQGARQAQAQDLDTLTALADRLGDARRSAEVALRQADYAEATGDYPAAIATARQAVALAQTSGVVESEAAGRFQWGRALFRQADYAAAHLQLEQALTLAQTARLPRVEADSLRNLGVVALYQSDYAGARGYYEQALRLYREIGDRRGESAALNNLGIVFRNQDDYAGARVYYEQALRLCREIGDRRGESNVLSNLGIVFKNQGDYTGARAYYEQALRLCRETGDRRSESIALNNLGEVVLEQGDYAGARVYYEQALQLCREIGNRRSESIALLNLGLIFHHLSDDEAAREYSQASLLITQDMGDRGEQGFALTNLGHALLGLRRLEEAADAYQEALALRRELGEHNLAMETLAGLARVALAQNELAQAHAHVDEILKHLETNTLDGTDEPLRVYLTCYHVLRAGHDLRARAILDAAYTILQERATRIGDEALQRSFLKNVPAHQELVAEWEAMNAD